MEIQNVKKITSTEYEAHFINQIITLAPDERSNSKPTTFALQFFGNEKTLMNNQGYSKEKSLRLVKSFHELYSGYFAEIDRTLDQGLKDGYVTVAYGLRVDCPAMAKSVTGSKVTPSVVDSERRSVGNAICQSYGAINTFAATDFMNRVWRSKWKYDIQIIGLIHDAIYLFFPQNLECIKWINDNLIECMVSQTHPDIQHPDVGLEAEFDIFYTSWANSCTLQNGIGVEEIQTQLTTFITEQNNE